MPKSRIIFQQTQFELSAPNLKSCPASEGKEIAFAGRSNAGKSSAINALTQQSKLARISKTPGRTQMLNYFKIGDQPFRLVDLPGYGFANVPLKVKAAWGQAMEDFLARRANLCGLVLMMDIRHPLTEFDQQMLSWCDQCQMPVHLLLTKADKFKYGAAKNRLFQVEKALTQRTWGMPISLQLFSATKKTGVEQLQTLLQDWFLADQEHSAEEA